MHVINIFPLLVQFLGRKLFSNMTRLISGWPWLCLRRDVAMFTATVVIIRPLDSETVETDIRQHIRQHPNKHVTF